MIDLHMHTKYSDGSDTVVEILKKAQSIGLDCISITDHNSVQAYFELEANDYKDIYKGKIIKGCEIETVYNGVPIEILGYNIDPIKIKPWLDKYFSDEAMINKYNVYIEYIKDQCDKLGIKYTKDLKITSANDSPAVIFMSDLAKYEGNEKYFDEVVWNNPGMFYRNCVSDSNNPFYIDVTNERIPLDEVINQIHLAGGKAFIAHPYIYTFDNIIETIDEIAKRYEVDGVECYYSLYTDEQTKEIIDYCKNNKLYICGGSDYHGANRDYDLGVGKGKLNVPNDIVDNWYI